MIVVVIGTKIKYCRTHLGITQSKLAGLSGIYPVSIRKYETGKVKKVKEPRLMNQAGSRLKQ